MFQWDQIRSFVVTVTTKIDCRQSSYVSVKTKHDCWPPKQNVGRHILSSLKHMMTAYSLFWWSASQQKIVFSLHWNIWCLPTVCFGGQRLNKRSCFVFTETYDDCLQSVFGGQHHNKRSYLVFTETYDDCLVCFGGQRLNKRSCFVFTETYDDCLQSVLVVSITTKDRIWSSLKHMMTAYSLFWWSAIVFCLHW
jgi:hypothetical protein